MKIVLAPDKFKGSLTGFEFCHGVASILESIEQVEVIKAPLADGGDGTIDVVNYYLNGEIICVEVSNPIGNPISAHYLYAESSKTAYIEMAEASGLKCLATEEQRCMETTTFGTGQLILHAIDQGAQHIILGIGGSATNDSGIGMATALGYRFLDQHKHELKPIGKSLTDITTIDDTLVDSRLKHISFKIACDVTNPLYGPDGAAYVYAKQKGASTADIRHLDQGLQRFSTVLNRHFILNVQNIKGAGAAGGLGAGAVAFLKGTLVPGIQLIKDIAQFDTLIQDADWIITGEGHLDTQTLSGKTLQGVLTSAKKQHINVAAFFGHIDLEQHNLQDLGITYADAITNHAEDLNDAIRRVTHYVDLMTRAFVNQVLRK
ncbi:glycerate kinase [Formosa agariphila KMM 3901]|uniref:Glycerate kinase n=1 Tax=Formosa agariphila (strain DSM 15362 / KCTC 12365 / LMG 23005 / KMM 3901 / M-2Alg 35-1) TaxID=1347342 RepID=T2KLM5_FORAG|nr:glycerate kinase [Formosa agariphila]CDF79348.1 glycerate kinase [Formosa agariphila KMM 3901]